MIHLIFALLARLRPRRSARLIIVVTRRRPVEPATLFPPPTAPEPTPEDWRELPTLWQAERKK